MSIARCTARGALVVVLSCTACVSNPAPSGWLAPAEQAPADPYGAWIDIRFARGDALGGELLAVEPDSVYLLVRDRVRAVPRAGVTDARIAFYDSQWGVLAMWTTLGSISTLSNGWFLGLTLPIWMIGGPIATGGQSRAPLASLRDVGWPGLSMYARFPQGLPENMPREMAGKRATR